jgi:tetratricopeptide (TPR) repeat protein
MRPLRLVTLDEAIWCATEVNDINALAADWCGQGLSIQHLQTQVHSEIEGWNDMAPPQSSRAGEQLVTRRAALATLALVSAALLKKVQLGPLTALLMEEFLAQCSVSITACHQLLRSDGFAAVEYALPQYLSLLTAIARYPSSYQQKAAYLASQGCRLMGLLSYHRLQFQEQVTYSKQAVEYAKLVGDRALCVMALAALGNAWDHMGDSAEMLRTFQEAVRSLDGVPLLVRSRVLAELAVAYAQQGQVQEALHYSGQARTVFSEEEDLPSFLFMNYDISHIIMNEGSAALRLGQHAEAGHDTTQASRRYQQAWDKLAQIEQVPRTIVVPERIRLRIVTQRSLAAVKLGNLEAFRAYLIEGVNGAQRLGSQKRRQEAIVSYRAAREKWPHESRVSELAELFLQ